MYGTRRKRNETFLLTNEVLTQEEGSTKTQVSDDIDGWMERTIVGFVTNSEDHVTNL